MSLDSANVVDDDFRHLGQRLQALRREQGLTLELLAADSGLSAGYLSQIENGQAVPSLTALQVIAAELGVDVAAFFPDERRATTRVVRASERRAFRFEPDSGEEYAVLAQQVKDSAFSAIYARHLPGGRELPFRHLGEEFGLILSGRLRVTIGSETRELGPGEWIHYSSQHGHAVDAVSEEPVEALWVLTPAVV
jgi:transcriptional regulator with XRE-family HTH domain